MNNSGIPHVQNERGREFILEVSGLTVRTRGETIIDNLNFSVNRGKVMAIVGPNGAGKTTLFRALMNTIPYSGTIRWKEGLRKGYVPQGLVVTDIPISVAEFLGFKSKVNPSGCLDAVGLEKNILKTSLGNLSGGQLQRVLLAWSIIDYPDILLFDEPTSGVDVGAEEPIYSKVKKMKEELGITILLITHNLHVVMHYSDCVLAINRKQLYHGQTSDLSHTGLVTLMTGNPVDLLDSMETQRGSEL